MKSLWLSSCALALTLLGAASATKAQDTPPHRWFYLATNFLPDENLPKNLELLRRAKAAGYNGVAVTDVKFDYLEKMPESYFRNARAFKDEATKLGIDIYPLVCGFGYEGGAEIQDPNLAEGFPVRDAPYIIEKGNAKAVLNPNESLKNGDFETNDANKIPGWNTPDAPGEKTFVDREVKHDGAASVRMENIGDANCRVIQTLKVSPWRQYHVSAWVKTQDFETPGAARTLALAPNGQVLTYTRWHIDRTQDWTHYEASFNSLENTEINIYFGVWGGRGGKIWWDNAKCEDASFSNLLRRPGCPLKVTGEDGTLYEEGRDFQPLTDPKTGNVPWPGSYDDYHQPPTLQLTPNSRIIEGQKLKISFYHALSAEEGSVAICPSEPKLYNILADQLRRIDDLWNPKGYFLSHDEIRQMNWCEACQKRNLTPGQLLADNVRRCTAVVKVAHPGAQLFIWSDMFDPNHNAVDNYYLVHGTLANSWEGLEKETSIVNWNYGARDKSLPFFADQGHSQIISVNYDDGPDQIKNWQTAAQNIKGAQSWMYTTWSNNYDGLENFAKAAWNQP